MPTGDIGFVNLGLEANTQVEIGKIVSISNLRPDYGDAHTCGMNGNFTIDVEYYGVDESGVSLKQQTLEGSSCFSVADCRQADGLAPTLACNLSEGISVNPFQLGIRGNWRPLRSWAYLSDRTTGRINNAGVYDSFEPFWTSFDGNERSNWQWGEKNTIVNPIGRGLESVDPLDRYKAELYGFDFNLVTASASNTTHAAIAFDSFEDYGYTNRLENLGECVPPRHWNFQDDLEENNTGIRLDSLYTHTGKKSLWIPLANGQPQSISITRALVDTSGSSTTGGIVNHQFLLRSCDLISSFNPPPGEYILSAWVRNVDQSISVGIPPTINVNGNSLVPGGPVIDGWQRVFEVFTLDDTDTEIQVTLDSGTAGAWYDDIRIQPYDAQMETYAYDAETLRLMSVLDVNNFATIYEYDEEGALKRTKKETERGIFTLQEVTTAKPKVTPQP